MINNFLAELETSYMITCCCTEKISRTYASERSFTRWFQQLQTDFCHFHQSCSDHSALRRKPLALLHVVVCVTAAAGCSVTTFPPLTLSAQPQLVAVSHILQREVITAATVTAAAAPAKATATDAQTHSQTAQSVGDF